MKYGLEVWHCGDWISTHSPELAYSTLDKAREHAQKMKAETGEKFRILIFLSKWKREVIEYV